MIVDRVVKILEVLEIILEVKDSFIVVFFIVFVDVNYSDERLDLSNVIVLSVVVINIKQGDNICEVE